MLSFAGCNDDHILLHYDPKCKYAKVGHGKNTGNGVYVAKGMYVAKGKYIEYAKDCVYITGGEYGKYAKEDASVKEGYN